MLCSTPLLMNPDDYRKQAEECVKLAQSARTDQRSALLEIVQAWLGLADQAAEDVLLNGDGAKTGGGRST